MESIVAPSLPTATFTPCCPVCCSGAARAAPLTEGEATLILAAALVMGLLCLELLLVLLLLGRWR